MRAEQFDASTAVCERVVWETVAYDSRAGYAFTREGIVQIISSAPTPGIPKGRVRLTFIHGGREYWRVIESHYSRRFLATLAKRFARDVVAGQAG